jgi:hypothetical protein
MPDINRSFNRFIDMTFPRYKGIGLEVVDGGYLWGRQKFTTLDEVDAEMKRRGMIISNSINKNKNHEQSKVNSETESH